MTLPLEINTVQVKLINKLKYKSTLGEGHFIGGGIQSTQRKPLTCHKLEPCIISCQQHYCIIKYRLDNATGTKNNASYFHCKILIKMLKYKATLTI